MRSKGSVYQPISLLAGDALRKLYLVVRHPVIVGGVEARTGVIKTTLKEGNVIIFLVEGKLVMLNFMYRREYGA